MNIKERLFEKSLFAKTNPATSQQIIDVARELDWVDGLEPETMQQRVTERYKNKYGSGIWIMFALKIIVPIVVQLFLEWFKQTKELSGNNE